MGTKGVLVARVSLENVVMETMVAPLNIVQGDSQRTVDVAAS